MPTRYQPNQYNKIKEHFREHPYYKLNKTVFRVFQEICPTMVMTTEQLFVDSAQTLDNILINGDISTEICQGLWTEKYNQYRTLDGITCSEEVTKHKVTMLFYAVMYGLASINHSHYRGKLQKTLHDNIIKLFYRDDINKCLSYEKQLREEINKHTEEQMSWMETYFTSSESLTEEINKLFRNKKTKDTKKKEDIYPTLPYNCPLNKMRIKRITAVGQMMVGWGWLEEFQHADDFERLFDGQSRKCNIKWIGKPYVVLMGLIKQLLEQDYMDKITGVSASSIINKQFGINASRNLERIDAENSKRILLVIDILNHNKPLPLNNIIDDETYDDVCKSVMQSVFSGDLHITKNLK